ncbi:serine O-acetyltransferase EpsC [Candidatus Electronema sp. JC]|uniref:serine O-acetyltransferase EpsC n=1 Tax=Candidatus Electronema sp. JC TaxID=3401570 RepID=UPI003AA9C244
MSGKTTEPCGCTAEVRLCAEPASDFIPSVVEKLAEGFSSRRWSSHIEPVEIPSRHETIELILEAQRILFPGYFSRSTLPSPSSLEYHLGHNLTIFHKNLSHQLNSALRHECFRRRHSCSLCGERSSELAAEFIRSLPQIRETLETDISAALEGDPAAANADEVIFSYPGLFAVLVYRLAHRLYELEVPLLPRIMSEYAYHRTAIDIHPGATIGESFFIDHGAGVVIGETSTIGRRVRLYQGVTLGALSLPKGAGRQLKHVKRHPTIEDDVIIYANATILGGETVIGARSIVGGNVWLTKSVGPDTKVLLKQPELVYIGKNGETNHNQ